MIDITLPTNNWMPRPHQLSLWKYLQHDHGKRALAIWHRRAGKDEVSLHHACCAAMARPGNYAHCLPEYAQGRKSIWDAVNPHTGKRRIDEVFPHALRSSTREQDMYIRLVNGSTWQVIGSDTYNTSLVGGSLAGLVMSEYALANPRAWGYARPMLEENDGWAVFITTPRGRNHAYETFKHAQRTPSWFCELLTAEDTGSLTPAQLDEALAEYCALYGVDAGTAQYRQEYLCFKPDALVMCHDRAKSICDIRPGDSVLTHTGRFRRVEQILQREYAGPMCRIEAYGSPDLVCTPEHPVYTCNPLQQTYSWKPAKEIAPGDWLVTPRMDARQPPIISAAMAKVIAWYATEGNVSGNAVHFSIGAHEPDYVADLLGALTECGRQATVVDVHGVTRISVNDVALADFLVAQCGSLAHHKRLPLGLLRGNEQVVWDTLFKGDGHIQQRVGRSLRFCYLCVSEGLLHQVVILGAALGYAGKIGSRPARQDLIEGRTVNCREGYQVQLGRNESHWNKANGKTRSAKNGMLGRVRAVSTEEYSGPVHNIEVAGDHSYVVNGRAVHNCDWQAAVLGSFYGHLMDDVRREGRITEIEPPPNAPVSRAWDLGIGDDTSIWFFSVVGSQVFIYDHVAQSGASLEWWRDEVVRRHEQYGWRHGIDYVPHDAKVRDIGTGRTRVETMQQLGLRPDLVPNHKLDDGINAVRRTLPLCVFHPRCEDGGISALEQYRRDWDDDKKTFRPHPLHNWASHSADSFRYMCMSWRRAPARVIAPTRRDGMVLPPPPEPRRGMVL